MPSVLVRRPQQLILAGAYGQVLSRPARANVGHTAWAERAFEPTTPAVLREPEVEADADGESNFEDYAFGNLPEDPTSHGIQEILNVRRSCGKINSVNYGFFQNEP